MKKIRGKDVAFGVLVALFDLFLIEGWKWIIERDSCLMTDITTGEMIPQICWGTSPTPMFLMTFAGIILTVWYIWSIIDYYLAPKKLGELCNH